MTDKNARRKNPPLCMTLTLEMDDTTTPGYNSVMEYFGPTLLLHTEHGTRPSDGVFVSKVEQFDFAQGLVAVSHYETEEDIHAVIPMAVFDRAQLETAHATLICLGGQPPALPHAKVTATARTTKTRPKPL